MSDNLQCKRFTVSGQVQGVGFRPFVFRLAERCNLGGSVRNTPEGVLVEAWGEAPALEQFRQALLADLPPLAKISVIRIADAPLPVTPLQAQQPEREFFISQTEPGLAHAVLISPDMATCADCLRDMADPHNRRHNYAFTNCTNCGPRYSIIAGMPYDRARTSMRCFPMCPECAREYADPRDRRFHAQPNACPDCGPQVWFIDASPQKARIRGAAAMRALALSLARGKIAAVKGLGGFHLVCDAASEPAVRSLRSRKNRPHKPLALMVADLDAAEKIALLGPAERALLLSAERPIVICPKLPPLRGAGASATALAGALAPDTGYLGIMLPYTPLHHLLLRAFAGEKRRAGADAAAALVMTSGNRGGEPIVLGNREALRELRGLADCFLLHDRDILIRTDDSLLRPVGAGAPGGQTTAPFMFLRRARGFAPRPLPLPAPAGNTLLALGAEMKNTICLTRGQHAFVSQHIGDMQNIGTVGFQAEMAAHLCRALQVTPDLLVADAHPDFSSHAARLGKSLAGPDFPRPGENLTATVADGPPLLRLQHHFAHAEAVLAENGQRGPALVLALDGTGYAPGGEIWGGELLLVNPGNGENARSGQACFDGYPEHLRLGSLAPLPLPGGEAAIREPWRIAHGMLHRLGLPLDGAWLPWLPEHAKTAGFIPRLLENNINTYLTSSCGRLFDAVSALLGLCLETTYEGQAAVRLEAAQGDPGQDFYAEFRSAGWAGLPCPVLRRPQTGACSGNQPALLLDTAALFKAIFMRLREGAETWRLARAFHWSLAEGLSELALRGSRLTGENAGRAITLVGLSGGVMQNLSLFSLLREKLSQRGLTPLAHRELPPNDGCIAYGQAVWAARRQSKFTKTTR